jgi:hypothetical protein
MIQLDNKAKMKSILNTPLVLLTFVMSFALLLAARAGLTCFQWAWPVTYLPLPLCTDGANTPYYEQTGWQCFKYILDSPYGWFCQSVGDGAIGCELISAPPGLTFDEKGGLCSDPHNCNADYYIHIDVPLNASTVAREDSCYGG